MQCNFCSTLQGWIAALYKLLIYTVMQRRPSISSGNPQHHFYITPITHMQSPVANRIFGRTVRKFVASAAADMWSYPSDCFFLIMMIFRRTFVKDPASHQPSHFELGLLFAKRQAQLYLSQHFRLFACPRKSYRQARNVDVNMRVSVFISGVAMRTAVSGKNNQMLP